jgi:hypothetical protein
MTGFCIYLNKIFYLLTTGKEKLCLKGAAEVAVAVTVRVKTPLGISGGI